MTHPIHALLAVVACLALLTAPAAADDEGVAIDVSVDNGTVDVEGTVDEDGTVEANTSVSTDETIDGEAEGTDGITEVGSTSNTTNGSIAVDGGVATDETSLDADASVSDGEDLDANVTASVDAETGDASLAADVTATTEETRYTETAQEDANGEPDANESPNTNGSSASSEQVDPSSGDSSDASNGDVAADSGGDAPDRGPAGPDRTGGAVGIIAVAGGAAVTRRIVTASANGSVPTGTLDSVTAGVEWLRAKLPRFVLPIGYSRYDDSDPLEHEVRAGLYDAIQTSPGVHLSGLERGVDVSLSSVRHHLRILEGETLVESHRIRGKRRYFPAGEVDPELVAALDEPATASVLCTVASLEPVSTSAVAEQLGRDPSTISHHLTRLAEDGLVERERAGQAVETRLSERSRRVLRVEADSGLPASAD